MQLKQAGWAMIRIEIKYTSVTTALVRSNALFCLSPRIYYMWQSKFSLMRSGQRRGESCGDTSKCTLEGERLAKTSLNIAWLREFISLTNNSNAKTLL